MIWILFFSQFVVADVFLAKVVIQYPDNEEKTFSYRFDEEKPKQLYDLPMKGKIECSLTPKFAVVDKMKVEMAVLQCTSDKAKTVFGVVASKSFPEHVHLFEGQKQYRIKVTLE